MLKNKKGFTLVELLISISAASLVIIIVYTLFGSALNFWSYGSEKIDAQQNARITLQMIEKDVKRALPNQYGDDPVMIEASGGKGVALRLKIYEDNKLKEIRYSKTADIIYRGVYINGIGTNTALAYGINDLEFNYYTNPNTSIQNRSVITVNIKVEFKNSIYKLSSNVYVRASALGGI